MVSMSNGMAVKSVCECKRLWLPVFRREHPQEAQIQYKL